MAKLEQLTKKQELLMHEVANEWKDFIFSCKNTEIDKQKALKGIEYIYTLSKLKTPTVVFVDSPMACQLAYNLIKSLEGKKDNVRANVRDNVWANVGDNVRANVGANVGDNVWANVWANVGANVWANIRDNVWANVWANVGDSKLEFQSFASYGSISDYGWVAFYDFFTRIGVLKHEGFNEFMSLIRSGVYDMIQLDGLCIVSSLPIKIERNEPGQLHSLKGSAIEFKDGYCQYYINGRNMPNWVFDKFLSNTLTKADFINETNEDVRAGIFELIESKGEGSMLEFLGAESVSEEVVVHANGDLETLTLYKTTETFPELEDLKGNTNVPLCWLRLVCPSTGTNYLISSDPSFETATEAAKFHRPQQIPFDLDYQWDARS